MPSCDSQFRKAHHRCHGTGRLYPYILVPDSLLHIQILIGLPLTYVVMILVSRDLYSIAVLEREY